jgi:hypothetical protein
MEPRYYEVWAANDANRIDEASAATGMALVGIADEKTGGIIVYVLASEVAALLEALNG